jgi:hypothetical protein
VQAGREVRRKGEDFKQTAEGNSIQFRKGKEKN